MAANDMKSAKETYSGFISATKVAIPIIAVITLIVVILIAD
ncbi:hypothetical protein [Erythrobacter litoralis]|uniref:Cytochrome c oxidase subunit IV bacterial aa3 type domain-containing protein n=1 Tax=Erythrobacter litoralis (strain HTCC2594) TaxID=314225 RepID=Q2NCN3_ERYLH|nr:hypothetical protein [Erythrobacter litoralis]ABC62558.1 hypothetical protein ELI_02330 [Erythrobacter litoralis HTCC2594]